MAILVRCCLYDQFRGKGWGPSLIHLTHESKLMKATYISTTKRGRMREGKGPKEWALKC